MKKHTVQIAVTENFEIPVVAVDEETAKARAMKIWRLAETVGQFQIADTTEDIVAVTPRT